jgi:hypothetical protein
MVESLRIKYSLGVLHGLLNDGVFSGELDLLDGDGFRFVDEGPVDKDGTGIHRDGGPAVSSDLVVAHAVFE